MKHFIFQKHTRFERFQTLYLLAGGVVQIRTGTSKRSYWKSNFDDPRDQGQFKLAAIYGGKNDEQ